MYSQRIGTVETGREYPEVSPGLKIMIMKDPILYSVSNPS